MNKKTAAIIMALFAFTAGMTCTTTGGSMKDEDAVDFESFAGEMADQGDFTVTVEGKPALSFYTGRRYAHYEAVILFGDDKEASSYQILYHTEHDVMLRQGGRLVAVPWRRMRTRLAPSYEKRLERSDLASGADERSRSLSAILDHEGVSGALLVEYGLEVGRVYHAMIGTEYYHLPPDGPEGPRRRANRVFILSDSPLPNENKSTPLYRGWRY